MNPLTQNGLKLQKFQREIQSGTRPDERSYMYEGTNTERPVNQVPLFQTRSSPLRKGKKTL